MLKGGWSLTNAERWVGGASPMLKGGWVEPHRERWVEPHRERWVGG